MLREKNLTLSQTLPHCVKGPLQTNENIENFSSFYEFFIFPVFMCFSLHCTKTASRICFSYSIIFHSCMKFIVN